jgi:hypothetical protein
MREQGGAGLDCGELTARAVAVAHHRDCGWGQAELSLLLQGAEGLADDGILVEVAVALTCQGVGANRHVGGFERAAAEPHVVKRANGGDQKVIPLKLFWTRHSLGRLLRVAQAHHACAII